MTAPSYVCAICETLIGDLEPFQVGLDGEAVHLDCLDTVTDEEEEDTWEPS